MDMEVILLLAVPAIFMIFGLGWFAARVDIKHLLERSKSLPKAYFQGLNFLLNEQPDRAIDSFIEAVKADPDTVELHFTLGGMFRRRGETDRAIRLHQSLLARNDLSAALIERAQLELAHDFFKAGMLDRAEEAFSALRTSGVAQQALEALTDIYEIEKEWTRAIETARELEAVANVDLRARIGQFHCELAQSALAQSRLDDAQSALDAALSTHRKSVRATILAGDLAFAQGDAARAIEHWIGVEKQSPLHMALVAERLMNAHRTLGQAAQGLRLLKAVLEQSPSVDVLDVVFRETLKQDDARAAHAVVLAELRKTPTLIGLDKLIEARVAIASPDQIPELELVKSLLHEQTRRRTRFTCSHCGFKARQFYWQCPGCRLWDTYVPRREEELEVMK